MSPCYHKHAFIQLNCSPEKAHIPTKAAVMGSLLSKPSKNNNSTTNRSSREASGNRTSGFEHFSESLRRSFRIKRQPSRAPASHTEAQTTNLHKTTSTPSRPEIPLSFRQASTEGPQATASPPPPRPQQPPTEVKADAVVAEKKPEAPARPSPPVSPTYALYTSGKISPPSSPGVRNVLETVAQETQAAKSVAAASLMSTIHHEDEAKPAAANLLLRLAPQEKSADPTPEKEVAPRPAVSLLAALEKRKEAKEEHESEDSTRKVLETIATDATAIKSNAAATLMAAFVPAEHQTDDDKQGVSEPVITGEVKPSKRLEHVEFVLSKLAPGDLSGEESPAEGIAVKPSARLLAAMERKKEQASLDAPEAETALAKSAEVDKMKSALTSKLSAFAERQAVEEAPVVADNKPSPRLEHVKDVLAKLGDDNGSDISTPEIETAPANPAVNLLASLRRKKEEEEEEGMMRKVSPPSSPKVTNVLETIASNVIEVKSTEAANLMASFVPDEKPKESQSSHAGSILAMLAPDDGNSPAQTPEHEVETKPSSQLLSALRRKQETAEEHENDSERQSTTPRSTGLTDVMETIASDAVGIKSKEAATLMSSFIPSVTVSVDSNNEGGLKNGDK